MSPRPALSPDQVREARRRWKAGTPLIDLAWRFGVSVLPVARAVHGRWPYQGIHPPGPMRVRRGPPRALTAAQVRAVRRRHVNGISVEDLARANHVAKIVVRRALYGRPPYDRVRSPPSFDRLRRRRRTASLTPTQVREARRRALAGEGLRSIGLRLGAGRDEMRRALRGARPYEGIQDPPPLATPAARPSPALATLQVHQVRRALRAGTPVRALAQRFGTTHPTIWAAARGRPPYGGIADPPPLPERSRKDRAVLSPSEVGRLRHAWTEGGRVRELARRHGVSPRTVLAALHGRGPYAEVKDPPPVRTSRPGRRPALTPARVAEVRRRREDGASVADLAERYGVHPVTIRKALREEGVYAAR